MKLQMRIVYLMITVCVLLPIAFSCYTRMDVEFRTMKPNEEFKLTVRDIELIEDALHKQMRKLNVRRETAIQSTIKPVWELDSVKEIDAELKEIHQLLGRLHNQKNFYRPKDKIYVGG